MQMVCPIPTIHFKPMENRKKTAKSESCQTFCQGLSISCVMSRPVTLTLCMCVCVCVGMYVCPCYYFPVRSGGAGRQSFVLSVELKSGAVTQDHWIKRGTALLMSLDN